MNTYSHALIGSLLCRYLEKYCDIQLDIDEFIMGNIIPDLRKTCVIHPHFMRFSLKYIQREIETLSEKILESKIVEKDYSLRLGIICHYYTDFFCYAHTKGYKQAIINHKRYEARLCDYFKNRLETITRIDLMPDKDYKKSALEINKRALELHKEYLKAPPSYGKDIYYSLLSCVGVIASLVGCSISNAAPFLEAMQHIESCSAEKPDYLMTAKRGFIAASTQDRVDNDRRLIAREKYRQAGRI